MPRIGSPAAARAASAVSRPSARSRCEVLDGRLRAGQDDEVGALDVGRRAREAHAHAGLAGERVEVGEVAHPAQADDGDVERASRAARAARAIASESSASMPRSSTNGSTPSVGRPVRPVELVEAGREDRLVAAELVDHEAGDVALVGRARARRRVPSSDANTPPRSMSPTSSTGRSAARARPMLVEVGGAQVDLGRAAGALADDDVVAGAQVGERVGDDRLAARP